MKSNFSAKFAFVICDPKGDDPVMDAESTELELGCSRLLNLVLTKIDAKNNPTSIPSKYLKFLKENYFRLSTILKLYDVNKFKSDHFLFLYAFSNDADYGVLSDFESNIVKKYGNIGFIPFSLSEVTASRLILLDKFRDFLTDLYSAGNLSPSKTKLVSDFYPLLSEEGREKLAKVVDFQERNSKDLDFLVNYCDTESRAIVTSKWL